MKNLTPIFPIIGVIIGFLLAWLKEFLQNKPKLKIRQHLNIKDWYNYFKKDQTYGKGIPCDLYSEADYLECSIAIDVYNIGKANTAIRGIKFFYEDNGTFNPVNIIMNGKVSEVSSFNLPPGSVTTLKLKLHIDKETNTEFLFEDDLQYHCSEYPEGLKFGIELLDIYGKTHLKNYTVYYIIPAF